MRSAVRSPVVGDNRVGTVSEQLTIGNVTVSFPALLDAAEAISDGSIRGGVHLCNAYTIALADERDDVRTALRADTVNLPDGTPVVWWARRRGINGAERVYGPDLMEAVLDRGRSHATRHYLYGSTPEVLEALEQAISARWPGAVIAGTESPSFGEITDEDLRQSVERATSLGATVVWVGMGTPKQDLLVNRMAAIGDSTYVAIGAAFDFIAGTKPQAPRWVMKIGMEWFYRLVSEPRRLWKRYLVYNAKFIKVLWRSRRLGGHEPANSS